jgi:hypothetical protein
MAHGGAVGRRMKKRRLAPTKWLCASHTGARARNASMVAKGPWHARTAAEST